MTQNGNKNYYLIQNSALEEAIVSEYDLFTKKSLDIEKDTPFNKIKRNFYRLFGNRHKDEDASEIVLADTYTNAHNEFVKDLSEHANKKSPVKEKNKKYYPQNEKDHSDDFKDY